MSAEFDPELREVLTLALRELERADRLRSEIESALRRKGFAEPAISGAMKQLERWGFVDDHRVVTDRVESLRRRKLGPQRILAKLEAQGIEAEGLVAVPIEEQVDEMSALLDKRPAGDPLAKAARYLAGRGYDEEAIEEVLRRRYPDLSEI